jgi:hypothetical protein
MQDQQQCPSCKAVWPGDAVMCVQCGTDLRTGGAYVPPAGDPPDVEEPTERPGLLMRAILWLGELAPGLFRVTIVLAVLVLIAGAGFLGMVALSLFGMGVLFGAIAVGAMAMTAYAQAMALLLAGEFRVLSSAMVDFTSQQWTLFLLLVLVPVIVPLALFRVIAESTGHW